MRAGQLDRRITIEQSVTTQGPTGEIIHTWQPLATVWARFEALTGRERFAAQQVIAELDARFTIRYRSDITPLMRIAFEDETYNIEAVLPVGRKRELQLLASVQTPEPAVAGGS